MPIFKEWPGRIVSAKRTRVQVMIYRLITRGTIEERMMQMTKKKMVLEHLVVGRLKAQNINQEELDDIIRYGSKDLFGDENDEAGKSRQIHYDEAAIDRLLDRDQDDPEETTVDDEEDDSFLKAFKVANFEYIEEAEAGEEEEAPKVAEETKSTPSTTTDRTSYWEELLKDKYEEHKTEKFNALGKGKRNRKQMVSVEDDDLAGLEDVSSDNEDDNYEADLSDSEAAAPGPQPGRRPYRKRARAESGEPHPLMEGEGRSFRVLGFNQSQRAAFVQILMRFGVGEYDWKEFVPRLKQKTYEEIRNYGVLFLTHISEDLIDSPNFSDGVPKEGLRIQDVLVRIATLMLIRDKVKWASENTRVPLFTEDIVFRYPGLKGGRFWKEGHDRMLLRAVLKHGYGRWQAIVDDKELRFQELICQELNLPVINLPVPGQPSSQGSNGPSVNAAESSAAPSTGNGSGSNSAAPDGAPGTSEAAANPGQQVYHDSAVLYHFRDMQRRQVEFIKKRVLLLEKGMNAEYQKLYFGEARPNEVGAQEIENEQKFTEAPAPSPMEMETLVAELPQVKPIAPEEIRAEACDDEPDRAELARLYNKMCRVVEDNVQEAVQAAVTDAPPSHKLRKNLLPLEHIFEDVNRILTPTRRDAPSAGQNEPTAGPAPSSSPQANAGGPADVAAAEPPSAADTAAYGGVKEEDGATPNGTSEKSESVIVLDN